MNQNLEQILAAISTAHGDQNEIGYLVKQMSGGNYSARKQLADAVCMLPAALPPKVLLEISRWGINDDLSQCAEIRAL